MTRIEHSVVIQASVEEVFRYAADYQRWQEWYVGVETEIHDFKQNRGWTGIATKGMPHRTAWMFEPVGSATRFTHVVEGHVPVPLFGSLFDSLFLKPQWDRIVKTSLNNLGRHFRP